VLDRAGITGGDGPSHHGLTDLALLRLVPNLVIATPSTSGEFRELLRTAVRHPGPVAIRYGKAIDDDAGPGEPIEVGEWAVRESPGGVLVIGQGDVLALAAETAAELSARGVPAGLADARWIAPLDPRLPEIAGRHRLLVTVEDHWLHGGFGEAVRELLASEGIDTPLVTCGVPHDYLPHGEVGVLRERSGLTPGRIAARVRARLAAS
jgi:1-deoxy-D-xylulose-5-phosphate synthase